MMLTCQPIPHGLVGCAPFSIFLTMSHTKAGKAFTGLILEIFQLNGKLLAAGDRLTKPFGLTSSRWQVLGAVGNQALTVAQIARQMGLARQNVQRLADALEKVLMVEYVPNPDHKLAMLVRPTALGRNALKNVEMRQKLWANTTASGMSVSEMDTAIEVLRKLRARLDAERLG
jgi:DNA-binding MarR family transcriptional regulator